MTTSARGANSPLDPTLVDSRSVAPRPESLSHDSPASQVADEIVAVLLQREAALSPVIGRLGVNALCRRCVHLAAAAHPWLLEAKGSDPSSVNLDVLRRVLASRTTSEATAGGQELLRHFLELLNSLIGMSLVERLLTPAPPQEPKP